MSKPLRSFMEGLFFSGDSRPYWHPAHYDLEGDFINLPADMEDDVSPVSALVLHPGKKWTKSEPRGTVVYFHSGQFNLQYNLLQVAFLAVEGYKVLLTDYPGCGVTQGKSSFAGLDKTVLGVLNWIESAGNLPPNGKVSVFGQGIGAHAALLLADATPDRINGLVLESCYGSQKGKIKAAYGPVIGDLLASQIEETQKQPDEILPLVSKSVLIVYPQKDDFARGEKKVIQRCMPEKAEWYEVPGKTYLNVFSGNFGTQHGKLLDFLDSCQKPAAEGKKK